MRVLLWILFSSCALLAVIVLGKGTWLIVDVLRVMNGPDLASPAFRLVPDSKGTWEPVWPAGFEWHSRLELWIETEPPWTDPDSFAVVVVATPVEVCDPCSDWIGAPTEWHQRGLGVLPIGSQRARELGQQRASPLCMRADGPARIEWRVDSASQDLASAETRLILRFPEESVPFALGYLRALTKAFLPPGLLLSLCTFLAAFALRVHRKRVATAL